MGIDKTIKRAMNKDVIIHKAAKLLRIGKYNVSEVAMMTDFDTVSHFSVSFKKQFGINPSEYK
ncbi:MAG: helix-turn-helix domain-containing protein [Tannerellaceae bacterium]|jgi:AraC-like DNA-binding protein|nr:helix-turn-helix domain-containing protein [Tannerellaceae bacterium]